MTSRAAQDTAGFLIIYRDERNPRDPIWGDPSPFDVRSARDDLKALARFAPGVTRTGVSLERGEFYVSVRSLARRWRWAVGTVHKYLKRLQRLGYIREQRRERDGIVYVVVDYDRCDPPSLTPRTPARTPLEHQSERQAKRPRERDEQSITDCHAGQLGRASVGVMNNTVNGPVNAIVNKENKGNRKNDIDDGLVAEMQAVWTAEMGGPIDFGRIKKRIKPLAELHPSATILAAFREMFRQNPKPEQRKFLSLERFVERFGLYGSCPTTGSRMSETRYRYLADEARRGMDMSDTSKYPDWPQYRERYQGREKATHGAI